MKIFFTIALCICSMLLCACKDTSIGIIGGADGPTKIIVGKPTDKPADQPENYNHTTTQDIVLKEAPALTVLYIDESVEALRGTSSWQYQNNDGTSTAIESDSMHPLQAKEYMTALKLLPSPYSSIEPYKAYLQWDVVPDKVYVRCWSEDCWGQYGNYEGTSEEISVDTLMIDSEPAAKPIISVKLKEGNCIYEVTAQWESYKNFSGTAHYSFYTIDCHSIDMSQALPIPAQQKGENQ